MDIYDKIEYLIKSNNISRKDMCKGANIGYGTYTSMLNRRSERILMDTIISISIFFNVTVDYLMDNDIPLEPILYKNSSNTQVTISSKERTEKIKEEIKKQYGSIRKFCEVANIPSTTLTSALSNDIGGMGFDKVAKICKILNLDILTFDNIKSNYKFQNITDDKQILLSSYDKLNSKGQEKAIERVEELTQIPKYTIDNISEELSITREDIKDINLYEIPASAGTGMLITDDVPYDIKQIDLTIAPQARKADFALYVRGDSMEPNYYDGDIVFVKEQPYIDNGQIGIFIYDNETYIKKYSIKEDGVYLISLNKKYPPIKIEENVIFKTCGIVL